MWVALSFYTVTGIIYSTSVLAILVPVRPRISFLLFSGGCGSLAVTRSPIADRAARIRPVLLDRRAY
ncbi:hypothetical protein DNK34_09860 [Pseudomonas dryadis]|uniref:Uncharacterized protein n=1 Tax=Phytopseudomonas dryadis TaxID=2487520 RepID=A0A4Q9R2F9_9GAMM|nr:hypothetical protein DNK44_10325 [Pseudomonas dryadis]TBV07116.1 hypothetical protein DNK34_09860 [Pseudomonas dryadis]TBV19490.1 hypothetical protein DNK41_02855 [Pseudomonas sp. FRB 230]